MPHISFSCLITPARSSSTMWTGMGAALPELFLILGGQRSPVVLYPFPSFIHICWSLLCARCYTEWQDHRGEEREPTTEHHMFKCYERQTHVCTSTWQERKHKWPRTCTDNSLGHSHASWIWQKPRRQPVLGVGKATEQWECSFTTAGRINGGNHFRNTLSFEKKTGHVHVLKPINSTCSSTA